ncbi:DMT family transporter [Vibrio sp. SM6]|uniref:DMT family transporter n=1 Tax=Vibrio agarilyticus TaxID=2726741 RepID=A0A7X8TUK3_9VIBR|nr:DMT family transporter [Vibrio agarilyticus]NLS14807.1 DMT family transporter [Vibrio agarilyticus]
MNSVLYGVTVLIWGSTWLAIYFQLDQAPILISVAWRFALASAVLFGFLWAKRTVLKISFSNHQVSLLLGMCLFSNNFLCFYHATQYFPSGLNAVVFSLAPIFNAVNGWLFYRQGVSRRFWQGALLGFGGVLLLFASQWMGMAMDTNVLKGLLLSLLGTYLFSLGNMVSAYGQKQKMPLLPTTAWAMGYGALFLFGLALLLNIPMTLPANPQYLVALGYLAVVGSVVGFNTYLALVGRIGAPNAAYCTVLFPIVALTLSTWFENYQWHWLSAVGVGLVMVGNLRVFGWPKWFSTRKHQGGLGHIRNE